MSDGRNPFDEYTTGSAPLATLPPPAGSKSGNPFDEYAEPAVASAADPQLREQTPQFDLSNPENIYKGIITFSQKVQQAREVGKMSFRESALGHSVMSGQMTLEEAEAKIAKDDEFAQMSGDLEQYEKDSAVPWLTAMTLETVKQLPMIEESLKVTAGGFAVGGGAAALTGAGAPFAVPVGLSTGTSATAGFVADLITGQEYLERRRKGVSHEVAAATSTISGLVQGALSGVQFGQAAKLATSTAKNILAAHAQSIAKMFVEGSKFTGVNLLLNEAQTATKLITDAIAGTVSKTPDAVPTLEQAAKEFGATFQQTLLTAPGLFVGGKATGAATGLTAKGLLKVLGKARDAHIKNQDAKLEKIKALAEEENLPGDEPDTDDADTDLGPSKASQEKARRTAERLEKRVAAEKEINRIFDAANSMFTIEHDETRIQEANRVQRVLRRMVTNSDRLDDGMKVKLLGRIVEIDSVADLLREGKRFIEDQRGREHANEVAAAEKRLTAAIKSGQVKGKKAALPQAAQASLKWYKEFFTEPESTNTGRKSEPGTGDMQEPKQKGSSGQERGRRGEPGAEGSQEPIGKNNAQLRETKDQMLAKAVDYVQRGIDDEVKQLEQQLEKLENNELAEIFNQPAELAEKRRIAMEAQQFWSGALDVDGMTKLAEQIEGIVETGKSEFLERKQKESQRLLGNRALVSEGVQGIKPVKPSEANSQPKEMTGIGKLMHSLRRNSTALWDKLLQDTPADVRQKLIRDVLDFTDVENREFAINLKATEKLTELYTNAVGTMREVNKLVRNGSKNEKFDVKYTDSDGNTQIIGRHSLNELVYLHMAMDDPGAVPGLIHGNKYTLEGMVETGQTSTQEAIRRILQEREGGKYLKLGEAVKDFYRWFAPMIANHYLKEYGVPLPMDDNYSGQIFHRQLERIKSAGDLLQDVHQYAQQTLDPGSVKLRKSSKLPIRAVDPFQQVQRHQGNMAFWIANSEKARELSFIFSDSSKDGLRDVIQHKLGKEFTGLIDGRLAFQFHLKPGIMDIGDKPIQGLKNNLATGLLGGRIDQAPKQWTSILGALSTNSYGEFVDGLQKASSKEHLQEYLSRSEVYKERQNELLPQILEATKERTYVDAVSGDNALAIKQFFLTPMSGWGDGVASAVTGFIEYNRVRKNGGTVEEAVLAGDSLVERSQSSSRASQKVPAEFKGGIGNLSLAFAKQNIQMMNLESSSIRDWFIHKDDKHLARMARAIVAIHTAQALFQTINSVPAWVVGDDQEKQDAQLRILSAAIGGSYSNLPLLGIDVVYGALSGWKGEQEPRTIIGGLAGDSAKLVKRLWTITRKMSEDEVVEGEDWSKAFQSAAAVGSVATGIPFWGLFKYYDLGQKIVEKGLSQ